MKKTLAIILALVMVCSLSVAFADPIASVTENNTATQDVTATATITPPDTVYSVDVAFGSFVFSYSNQKGAWQPASHSYAADTAGWATNTEATVTVTNHSDAGIAIGVEFAALEAYTGKVTLSFTGGAASLATAVGTEYANAPKTTFTGTIGGTPTENITAGTKVGTVTVTITAPTV